MENLVLYIGLVGFSLWVFRGLYVYLLDVKGDFRLHAHLERMQGSRHARMSEAEFLQLKCGLQADGWIYDPAFYRFTKDGRPDYLPDRAPCRWPKEPGENIMMRGIRRAMFVRQMA